LLCCGGSNLSDSLFNSLKYGQKTTTIKVSFEKTDEHQRKLFCEDNGVGILVADKPKLFKEGYTTGGSTGYGLYLIKKMMEVYGWTLKEAGEPGRGARFVFTIPRLNSNGKENYQFR
jgi:signal transduction histidine kinase